MIDFLYSVVASPLHDADAVDRITTPVRAELDALGGRRSDDAVGDGGESPHLIVVATGGTERAIIDLVERRCERVPWEPVVLVVHPHHNSLPAALEALARLRRDGATGRIVQVPGSDDIHDLRDLLVDLRALHWLHHARLGLVGKPSDWLVASVPYRRRMRERWGIATVDIDIADTIAEHRTVDEGDVRAVAVRFTPRGEPDAETMTAAALHPALASAIDRARVDAVAVRCFDFITELSTSGCVALAELNDTGVVAGCEGDVASTVAMMLVRALLDEPSWIANPAVIDEGANTILLAHCTVAPSMVDDLELHTHFESDLGIGLRGTFAPGWVTLLRLGGDELELHRFMEAEIVETGDSPDLCRTQVTVRVVDEPVGSVLENPLGNHLVMVRGRHRDRLERWWRLAFGDR